MYNIDKLRTLCLFQSDFNHNNKFLGKKVMDNVVQNKLCALEQYSMSGKQCITPAHNRTMLFDLTRDSKGCLSMTSCDLKSCYDRIAHLPATLALRSVGCPIEPLLSMFSTIQNVQYFT